MAVPGRVARALPGLLLAMGIAALDQTALSPALPAIAGDLGGLDAMPLVISAYLVAATAVMPVYGRLGDTVGRVPLLQAALALFGLGAAASALAPDLGWLVAGRIVQGAGGGGLMIGAQAAIGDLVSPRERGRYLGLFGAVYVVAAVAGPVLGGIVADAASWRWIFAVHPPLALAAMATIAATLRLPRPDRAARPRFDAAGALGLAAAVVGVALLAGAPGSGAALPAAGAVLCAGGAAVWLVSARRAADPVLPPRLLRDRAIGIPAAIAFLIGAALFGSIAYMPAYLQIALGASALEAGLLVTALMGGVLVSTVVSGRLVTRTGRYRGYPIAGTAVAGVALLLLSQLGSQPAPLHVTAVLALLGLGIGLVMQIMVLAAQNAAGPADTGSATAAVTFLRQIGASAGVAAFGALITVRFGALLPDALAQRVGGARLGAEALDGLAPGERAAVAEAFGAALPPLLGMAAPLMGAAFVLALLLPSRPLRDTPHADSADPPATAAGSTARPPTQEHP